MTKIEEIRNILTGTEHIIKTSTIEAIITAISTESMEDEKIMAFVEKKNISFDELKTYSENYIKKANRTKHTFSTFDELNAFTANNNCGDSWIDGENYSVYKY